MQIRARLIVIPKFCEVSFYQDLMSCPLYVHKKIFNMNLYYILYIYAPTVIFILAVLNYFGVFPNYFPKICDKIILTKNYFKKREFDILKIEALESHLSPSSGHGYANLKLKIIYEGKSFKIAEIGFDRSGYDKRIRDVISQLLSINSNIIFDKETQKYIKEKNILDYIRINYPFEYLWIKFGHIFFFFIFVIFLLISIFTIF